MRAQDKIRFIEIYRNSTGVIPYSELQMDDSMQTDTWLESIKTNELFYKDCFLELFIKTKAFVESVQDDKISHDVLVSPTQIWSINDQPVILPKIILNDIEDSDWMKKETALKFLDYAIDNWEHFWGYMLISLVIMVGGSNNLLSMNFVNAEAYTPENDPMKLFLLFKIKIFNSINQELVSPDIIDKAIQDINLGTGSKVQEYFTGFKIKPNSCEFNEAMQDIDPVFKKLLIRGDLMPLKFIQEDAMQAKNLDFRKIALDILEDQLTSKNNITSVQKILKAI